MTDTATQAITQVTSTEPQSDVAHADVPTWKELADDVEYAAGPFSDAVEKLTELLDQFNWEDDVPEGVQEAAEAAGLAVYEAAADVERRLRKLNEAVIADADAAD
jgi:hypothetical protein